MGGVSGKQGGVVSKWEVLVISREVSKWEVLVVSRVVSKWEVLVVSRVAWS